MPQFNVNGQPVSVDVDDDTPLLWVLRDHLNLCGTKFGCGKGLCGACTVHVDGRATRSCVLPVAAVEGQEVTTIEGLGGDHPVQRAWIEHDVAQCGYCQSGQIMAAVSLLRQNPTPSMDQVRHAMSGNICRCGTYNKVLLAIDSVSKENINNSSVQEFDPKSPVIIEEVVQ